MAFAAFGYLIFFGKKIRKKEILAIGIAFLGSVVIAMADTGGGAGKNAVLGDILALFSGLFLGLLYADRDQGTKPYEHHGVYIRPLLGLLFIPAGLRRRFRCAHDRL